MRYGLFVSLILHSFRTDLRMIFLFRSVWHSLRASWRKIYDFRLKLTFAIVIPRRTLISLLLHFLFYIHTRQDSQTS
jgi:hypothetical protein